MNPIGGEIELKKQHYYAHFTDSGRSSLRLFLRSRDNKTKKYLLPNFLCQIIEDVFIEENIDYKFYNIFENLTIDIDYIKNQEFDVLYIINYFGQITNLSNLDLDNTILLEDNVFLYNFNNHHNAKNWYAFNSFRKISAHPDGSMVKTTLFNIDKTLIQDISSPFAKVKIQAKHIKYDYKYLNLHTEDDYLSKFEKAEQLIDEQKDIYKISSNSIRLLLESNNHTQIVQQKRFEKLYKILQSYCLNTNSKYYSFFTMSIPNRDKFRNKLKENRIFLPIHWPQSTQKNSLYDSIISIPLFENYSDSEFEFMIQKIKEIV